MGKINWKVVFFILLYVLMAYSYPPLRPANIAHSIGVFATSLQQDLQQSGG